MVNRHRLHRFVDKARIRAAIAAAETVTSTPIHVSVAPYFWGDVRRTAERAFASRRRSGVLIFVVPARREFAIVGDAGAHAALGQAMWDALARGFAQQLQDGDPTAALTSTIADLARALAAP